MEDTIKEETIDSFKEEKLEELKKKHERTIRRHERREEKEKKDEMLKSLTESVKDLESKLLYQQAEFANYKRRREEETSNLLKYKNADFALELLTVIDSLERALGVSEDKMTDEVKKYLSGFKIMYNNLVSIMRKFEIVEIDCLNKEFDHNTSQALMTEKVEGIEEGIVVEVLQKGYMLKDKLLRPSLVKVSE